VGLNDLPCAMQASANGLKTKTFGVRPLEDVYKRQAVNHVVRTVRFAFHARCFGEHDGMASGRADFCFQPDLAAMFHEPFGAGEQILFVLRLRGDAGETEQFTQLGHEAGLVVFQIIKDDLHGG